jgi:hypothetical protein
MPDENKPVVVTMVDTGGSVEKGVEATTPAGQSNIIVNVVHPFVAIAVRFLHNYLLMLVTTISAGVTTDLLPAGEFIDLFWIAAKLSFAGAALGALKDTVTILARLESRWPLVTGGV